LVLIWLAGDPLALRPEDVREDGPLWWAGDAFLRVPAVRMLEPRGDVSGFPSRFRWKKVPGATLYELALGPDVRGAAPLARTSGASPSVDVVLDPGMPAPRPGDYVWEIRARRGEDYLARGVARFRLTGTP
jgi:hypothetical protein